MNRNPIKTLSLLAITACLPGLACAQPGGQKKLPPKRVLEHRVAPAVAFGMNFYRQKTSDTKAKPGYISNFGFEYAAHGQSGFGFQTGLSIENDILQMKNDRITNNQWLVDIENENFLLRTEIHEFEERQTNLGLSMPLMASYQHSWFYVGLGVVGYLPLKSTFETNAKSLTTKGYFPTYDRWIEDQPHIGFGTQTAFNHRGIVIPTYRIGARAEVAIRIPFEELFSFNFGVFAEYDLGKMQTIEAPFIVDYSTDEQVLIYRSIVNTNTLQTSIKRIRVGISLAFSINVRSR